MMVPSAPVGWVPSIVEEPEGALRMLAPSDCTRAPIAKLPGAGAAVTVMLAVPFLPPLVAVIVADPVATPVTSPFALTVAMDGLLDAQVMVWPLRELPAESRGVAVN